MTASSDVLVVGGGPAGSSVARLLAARGWSVALVDRGQFPRAKACGECLNPGAVQALARQGLLDRVAALAPARLDGWRIESGDRIASGRFPGGTHGLSLSRARLDSVLIQAASAAGVRVEEGVRVLGLAPTDRGGTRVLVRDARNEPSTRTARMVVGADGLRSVLARSLAAYRRPPRLRKLSLTLHVKGVDADPAWGRLHLDDRGTVGLAPLDPTGQRWNATIVVAARVDRRAAARDPTGFALFRLERILGRGWSGSAVEGPWASGPFDWPGRTAVADGVVLVGDAAGYYDPLTGQGIYRALRSAELAADAVDSALRAGRVSRDDFAPYDVALRREFRAARRVQRGVEAVVSRHPLRPAALALLGRVPRAMDLLIGVTGDTTAARALLRPGLWADLVKPGRSIG